MAFSIPTKSFLKTSSSCERERKAKINYFSSHYNNFNEDVCEEMTSTKRATLHIQTKAHELSLMNQKLRNEL